ncbi:MAG: hypothetical protein KGZ92_04855 [Firmicutes bacterium]|nr:hypothetical protein [Dethiobacter sp.]MBS3888615.1 hypothetical protein [Bacillota bacterium]
MGGRRCRPARPGKRWNSQAYDTEFYAMAVIVGVQGVRLLVRPTIVDGIIFVACVVAMAPWERWL